MFRVDSHQVITITTDVAEIVDYGVKMLNIPAHWFETKGEGIGVAILDTGIDLEHPDLKSNLKLALDFSGENDPRDRHGHGTHVAGIIGANDNQSGIIGIAPRCNLFSLKVLTSQGAGTDAMLHNALRWVLHNHKTHNIRVVNMSLGSPEPNPALLQVLIQLRDQGVICLCAAGNEGQAGSGSSTVNFPARYWEQEACMSIGAVNEIERAAFFSSTGPNHVTFVGPGANIFSTYPGGKYARLSGTSMATPAIVGLVTLLLAAHKPVDLDKNALLTLKEVVEHMKEFSKDLGTMGYDSQYGWGLPVWV